MPKITQIKPNKITNRVAVYIDYSFCAAIRRTIWEKMDLAEGSEISCTELHQKEVLLWKQSNKQNIIFNSKQAVDRTAEWLRQHLPNLDTRVIDFRFGYNNHPVAISYPSTRNDQNISLMLKGTATEVITLEVASTEIKRGINYWVQANKIAYTQSQTNRDAWVVLYYKYPDEQFVWIKPMVDKQYKREELIGNTKNYFVVFNYRGPEVHSSPEFCKYVQDKIDKMISETTESSNGLQITSDKSS